MSESNERIATIESDDEVEEEAIAENLLSYDAKNHDIQEIENIDSSKSKNDVKRSNGLNFSQLSLSRPLIKALSDMNFLNPTPIQIRAIPEALKGYDTCCSAATGSGKTAAYLLPILERLLYRPKHIPAIRAVILAPTRELATQVSTVCKKLAKYTKIQIETVVGGVDIHAQSRKLKKKPDIIVCTPGRLIDHLRNTIGIDLDSLEILVLDESDRLLEMGFQEELFEIVKFCPKKRQTMLFTATMTSTISQLVNLSLNKPVRISVDALYNTATSLRQEFVKINSLEQDSETQLPSQVEREATLLSLCKRIFKKRVMIFFKRKYRCKRVAALFQLSELKSVQLHGDMTQESRLESLAQFTSGETNYLLCTNVCSRGLDVPGVQTVINFEMPRDLTTYVHRVGRTARAGKSGLALTFSTFKGPQKQMLKQINKKAKGSMKIRKVDEGSIEDLKVFINSNEKQIVKFLEEVIMKKKLKRAEKEIKKLDNLMKYEKQIFSRPARTWFQTEKQKKISKLRGNIFSKGEDESQKHNHVIYPKKLKRKRLLPINQGKVSGDSKTKNSDFSFREKKLEMHDTNFIDKRTKSSGSNVFKETNYLATGGLRKGGKLARKKFKSKKQYKRR